MNDIKYRLQGIYSVNTRLTPLNRDLTREEYDRLKYTTDVEIKGISDTNLIETYVTFALWLPDSNNPDLDKDKQIEVTVVTTFELQDYHKALDSNKGKLPVSTITNFLSISIDHTRGFLAAITIGTRLQHFHIPLIARNTLVKRCLVKENYF